jgi:hypothetical protein
MLGMGYMQAGNHAAANAVMELLPALLADMMASSPYGAQMQQRAAGERQELPAEGELISAAAAPAATPGPAVVPGDTNRGVVVDNAVVTADGTRLLFHTLPQRGDPNSGSDCPLNFYAASLRPGLSAAVAVPLATEVCGFTGTSGRLLDNGDLLLVTRNWWQRWRDGKIQSSANLAALPAMGKEGYDAARGAHLVAIGPNGETALSIPGGGYMPREFDGASFLLVVLSAQGKQRWLHPQQGGNVNNIWLGADGTLLAHVISIGDQQAGGTMASRHLLQVFSSDGQSLGAVEIASDSGPSLEELLSAGEKGIESALTLANAAIAESVERIAVKPAPGGGFHVLIERHSDAGERYGHFLYRIGQDGVVLDERPLNRMIRPYRLEHWVDFSINGKELYLLASVMADQPGVKSRRKQYRQTVVGRIDLAGGFREARLIPLDHRYLEAAMNAGDEEIQTLENMPGGDPVLLSRIGDRPLAVTLGYLSRRQVPRVDAVDENLAVFARAR